jgi:hypothetical protein
MKDRTIGNCIFSSAKLQVLNDFSKYLLKMQNVHFVKKIDVPQQAATDPAFLAIYNGKQKIKRQANNRLHI